MEPHLLTFSSISFAAVSMWAAYISYRCANPPNRPRNIGERNFQDSIANHGTFFLLSVARGVFAIISFWQSVAALCGDQVATSSCKLHPQMGSSFQIDTTFFTWNWWSAMAFGLAIPAGLLRLRAYTDLGKDFTFELQKPTSLTTSGVYRYVQHPSYSTLIVVFLFSAGWFLRRDGILATILPVVVLEIWSGYGYMIGTAAQIAVMAGIGLRVREEEAMLKEHFGKEWIDWHKKTARFIPFII